MTPPSTLAHRAVLLAMTALFLVSPAAVAAHAELLETTPADAATVEETPAEIVAAFDEALLPASKLELWDATGASVVVGTIDPGDPTRLVISDVPELAPGTYEAGWQAATADGHIERGTWSFTAAAPIPTKALPISTPTAAPSAAASAASSPTVEPTPATSPPASPGPSDPAGGTGGDVILPIVAALAIVAIGAGWLLSRRGRPSDGV